MAVSILKKYNINPADYEDSVDEPQSILQKYNINPRDYEDELIAENRKESGLDDSMTNERPSISGDIKKGLMSAPEALMHALGSLPGEIGGAAMRPFRSAQNIPVGLAEGLLGAYNLPGILSKYGESRGVPGSQFLGKVSPEPLNTELLKEALIGKRQPGDVLTQGMAAFAPYSRIGKAAAGLSGAATRAGQAALFNATQGQNPIEGAAAGALGELLGKGVGHVYNDTGKAVNALRPTNLFPGRLSPDELRRNLAASEGASTNLGRIIGSPKLTQLYENILPHVPFSGVEKQMSQAAEHITGKGNDLLNKLGFENAPENAGQAIQHALKQASSEANKQKSANYKAVEDAAEKSGIMVGREHTSKKAGEILNDIKKSPELEAEFDPKLMATLRRLTSSDTELPLKLSNIYRGKIGDMASTAYKNGNKYEYGLLKDLKSALDRDINQSIELSGNDNLKLLNERARKHYAEEVAPFEERNIKRFIREGGDSDLILSTFLKNSKVNDRSNLLSKLMSKLPEEHQNLPALSYFSRALEQGRVNPLKFKTLHKNLGEKQFKELVPNEKIRNDIENYSNVTGMNVEPLTAMFNPKTGARGQLPDVLKVLAGVIGGQYMSPATIASAAALTYGTRTGAKKLTSEAVRKKFVQTLIENKENGGKAKVMPPSKYMKTIENYATKENLGRLAAIESSKNKKEQ